MSANTKKKTQISLKDVPKDIFDMLVKEQSRLKIEKGLAQYGLEQTIYSLLRGERRKLDNEKILK